MDHLPDWAVTIIAVAVGLSSGLALLMARRIAWLLQHRPSRSHQGDTAPSRAIAPSWRAGPIGTEAGPARCESDPGLRPRPFRFPSGDPAARNSIRHSGPQRVAWRNYIERRGGAAPGGGDPDAALYTELGSVRNTKPDAILLTDSQRTVSRGNHARPPSQA
jgi:hypothetical protein